jgi:hypothetical protein
MQIDPSSTNQYLSSFRKARYITTVTTSVTLSANKNSPPIDPFGGSTLDDSADPELQALIHSAYDNICRAQDSEKRAVLDFNKGSRNIKKGSFTRLVRTWYSRQHDILKSAQVIGGRRYYKRRKNPSDT